LHLGLRPRRAGSSERGLAGLAIRVLDFFGIKPAEKAARERLVGNRRGEAVRSGHRQP
jgi:hypothetical protein